MSRTSGCLGSIGRAVALLLSVLLTIALPVSLAAQAVSRLVFSPQRMTDLIVSRVVENDQLRRQLVAQLFSRRGSPVDNAEGLDMAQAASHLEPAQLDAIADALFPPGWLAEQIPSVLNQLYAWADNDELIPDLTLDLRPVSAWLRSGGVHELIEIIIESWPACSLQQVEQMLVDAVRKGRVVVQYCEPPEPYRTALTEFAAATLLTRVEAWPSQLRLSGVAASTDAEELEAAKEQIRLVRAYLTYGWVLPLSLLGLIMALAVRSYQELTRWWGIPLLAGGLLGFGLLPFGGAALEQAVARFAESQPSDVLAQLVTGLAGGLISEARRQLSWQLLLLTVGAVGLLVSGAVLGRRRKVSDLGSVPPSALNR